ncbi:hypothetical protein BJX68DRAFT_165473 [Aspergillus pseudodeflectus]|uniref:HMG box domain-containing protein n=1 Tax=Aspergillus pseudodeflectus TaxID=176178 RepID=A0ABR4L1K9_9EURO
MPLNLVRRGGGAFRSALACPVRVVVRQSHIKRLSFVAHRPLPTAVTAGFPRSRLLVGDLIRSYATKGAPKGSNTEATANKKPKKATKPVKKPAKRRRVLTPEQIEKKEAKKKAAEHRQLVRSLKETALQPPKRLPTVARVIAVGRKYAEARAATSGGVTEVLKKAIALTDSMSADEREQYKNQAEANKIANEAAYEAWIKSHTPKQIQEANHARRRLGQLNVTKRVVLLKDDRLVKRPTGPYFFFIADKREAGSGIGKSVTEEASHLGEEWKNLTQAEKEKYIQLAKADSERYDREHLETYGIPPPSLATSKSKK